MGDDHDGSGTFGEDVFQSRGHPPVEVPKALALRKGVTENVGLPFLVLARVELARLLEGQTLPQSGVDLP